jgi:hypothetical protein
MPLSAVASKLSSTMGFVATLWKRLSPRNHARAALGRCR